VRYNSDSDIILTQDFENSIKESEVNRIWQSESSSHSFEWDLDVESEDDFELLVKLKVRMRSLETKSEGKNEGRNAVNDPYRQKNAVQMIDFQMAMVGDQIVLLIFPVILIINWFFYDETGIGSNFTILKDGYIYYFLFMVVFIPFQILCDVVCLNIIEH